MRSAVFLQVRMASSRFPGKALAPLGESTVVEQAMARLSQVPTDAHFIVTDEPSFKSFQPLIEPSEMWTWKRKWGIFVGPTDDVMLRFIECARENEVELIVRATGDSPLVDEQMARRLLDIAMWSPAGATRVLGMTPGTAVEVVTRDALEAVWPQAGVWAREHVMPKVYESFTLVMNTLWARPTYRESVTVDTPHDLERVARILANKGPEA